MVGSDENSLRKLVLRLGFIVTAFAAVIVAATPASAQALHEEATFLTVDIGGRPYRLDAMIVKPARASGPLPIALITHGKAREAEKNAEIRADRMLPQARDFARRGWLAVAVVRRGFGVSEGAQAASVSCTGGNFPANFARNADDLEAALKAVMRRVDADATRAIAVGVSAGGAAVLALAARQPKGLVAAINVSGGLRVMRRNGDACPYQDGLVATLATLGARAKVPTLWIYAENDSRFEPQLVRAMHDAFTRTGGRAELLMLPPIGKDGHGIWSMFAGRRHWLPALDRFLMANALPTWNRGALEARVAEQGLAVTSRPAIQSYYDAPGEKVMSVSTLTRRVYWWADKELDLARSRSVERCEKVSREPCKVMIENFELVGEGAKGDN